MLDLARLRKAACECYGTVEAHHDRLLVKPWGPSAATSLLPPCVAREHGAA
jgi:hypothetical protein